MSEWALITGASSGIGAAFAEVMAKDGLHVILVARDKSGLQEVAKRVQKKYSAKTHVISCDLATHAGVQTVIDFVQNINITPKYLVNNAGFGDYSAFTQADWQRLEDMMQLNMQAVTKLSHHFAQVMTNKSGGHILNVASVAAFLSGPRMAVYYATKAYVLHLSEALDIELAPSGVRVTALCPGPTASKFAKNAHVSGGLFSGKLPTAEEVAVFGYKAMLADKPVAIHGLRNKVLVFTSRFIPRRFMATFVGRAQP